MPPFSQAEKLQRLGTPGPVAEHMAAQQAGALVSGVPALGTANATDLATAIALANATKVRLNELIAALKV